MMCTALSSCAVGCEHGDVDGNANANGASARDDCDDSLPMKIHGLNCEHTYTGPLKFAHEIRTFDGRALAKSRLWWSIDPTSMLYQC